MLLKRRLTRTEILLIIMLVIAIIATSFKWQEIKEGVVKSWKYFSIEKWYEKD